LANEQMNTAASYSPKYKSEALGDYVDYLMQDFAKAQQLVQTRPTLEGLPMTKDNKPLLRSEEIYDSLKSRVAAEAKAATKQREQEQAFDQQKLTQPKDQMAMFKESEAQVEEQKKNVEPNFDYLDPMFEKALEGQTVIAVDPSVKPIPRGPQIREKIDSLIAEADKADQDYRTARYALPAQGKRGAPERAAAMEALTKGKTALAKIEQLSKEGGAYAREVIAARRAQQEAMAKLSDITEQLRTEQTLGGNNREMAASTEQSLSKQSRASAGSAYLFCASRSRVEPPCRRPTCYYSRRSISKLRLLCLMRSMTGLPDLMPSLHKQSLKMWLYSLRRCVLTRSFALR